MSIKVKNNVNKISNQLKQKIDKAMEEIGLTATADVKNNSPVLSGKLKKFYTFTTKSSGLKKKVIIGNIVPYAPYVEFKPPSKGGRPHLRATLRSNQGVYKQILIKHLRGL